MKHLLLAALLFAAPASFAGPRVVKNGGDIYAIEFLGIGQQVLKTLETHTLKTKVDLKKLAAAVDETTVESVSTPLMLEKVEKDAINYPQKKYIVFNRVTWAGRDDLSEKAKLVLHEYLGIAGIPDQKYQVSSALIEETSYGKVTYSGQVFDRKLTKAEMQRLLPIYLNFIAARAKDVPSPEDAYYLGMIKHGADRPTMHAAIKNPVPGKPDIVGEQVYPINSIKKWVEGSLQDLKDITDADRVASTTRLLDGFKSSPGTITCELGYSGLGRFDDRRIVKCEDNRSQPPSNDDDEGFSDVRTIILSIDPASLSPIGVLSLDIFQAG